MEMQVHSFADVPWTFNPQLELKLMQRAAAMHSVSCPSVLLSAAAPVGAYLRSQQLLSPTLITRHMLLQVSIAVAPLFQPPVPSVKLDLSKMKPDRTFLTQMQSARLPTGKKRRENKSGFLSDRGGVNGSRAHAGAGQSLLASEVAGKAPLHSGRKAGAGN
jgi:hypothetical protein